jgi:hypothetical protein
MPIAWRYQGRAGQDGLTVLRFAHGNLAQGVKALGKRVSKS